MTSIPASRRARATTFAPRSWPSSPGLAITTRIRPCATATSATFLVLPSRRGAARTYLGRYYRRAIRHPDRKEHRAVPEEPTTQRTAYLPPRAGKARKLILRTQLGLPWMLAAIAFGVVILVA